MKKRLLALALCLVMLIGLIPAALAGSEPLADNITVHFVTNGGTLPDEGFDTDVQGNKTKQVARGSKIGSVVPTMDDFTFEGWHTNPACTDPAWNMEDWAVSKSAEDEDPNNFWLFAKWKYTVSFNLNGGTGTAPAVVTADKGQPVTLPAAVDATKAGYVFAGWSTSQSAIEPDAFHSAPVLCNMTLYAVWKQAVSDKVTVTYRPGFASGDAMVESVQKGLDYKLQSPSESWTVGSDYKFDGWTGPDGLVYQPGDVINNIQESTIPYVGWTFVARYELKSDKEYAVSYSDYAKNGATTSLDVPNNTTVQLKLDGGKYEGSTTNTTLLVKGKNLRVSDATKDGARFLGWQKSGEGNAIVLTAKWEPAKEHTLTFTCWSHGYESIKLANNTTIVLEPNGGSFVHNGTSYTKSKTFQLTADYTLKDATRTGYFFYGWYVTENSQGTLTFTAMWTRNTSSTYDVYYYDYTDSKYEYYRFTAGTYLVFDPNGGTAKLNNTSFSSQKGFYIYNDYTLSDAVRTGYTFYGWYLTKSGSTYTFTAMWSKSASTVPYMLNGEDHYAYIKGYPNGSFKPNATITRAETAAIFYRLLTDTTRKAYTTTYNAFKDVPAKAWYNTAVSTMAKLGIVTGDANGYFRPSDPITRAEIAAMIARCDGSYYGSSYTNFSDVKGHWAASYIARAYELGWINGYGTTYAPDKYITRAETVAILNRVLNRAPQNTSDLLSGRNTFSDVGTASWYYLDVEEAANSHTYTRKSSGYEYWNRLIADPSWL